MLPKTFMGFVRFLTPLLLLLIFTLALNQFVLSNPENIRRWLDGFGIYAVVAYIVAQTLAIVVAPIGGASFALAVLALFGPLKGTLLIYLVTTPAYIINFLLARKYGKKIVHKLVGIEGEALIDRFMTGITARKLTFMKLFLGGYFDYISYGVGLSALSLKDFILINIFAGIPSALFTWSVMKFTPNFISGVIVFYVVPAIFGLAYLGAARYKKKGTQEPQNLLEHEI